jgi:predicted nucleic acid-binding protein
MKEFNIQPDSTYFIDTNIWLYSFIQSQNKEKTKIASAIIKKCDIVISTQIVNVRGESLIKAWREYFKLTQAELATKAGMKKSANY